MTNTNHALPRRPASGESKPLPRLASGWLTLGMLVAFMTLGAGGSAFGDSSAPAGSATQFAEYVPATVKLFVAVRELGEADRALRRAHAWRLLPLLAGGSSEGGQSPDLRRAVTSLLGLDASADSEGLMRSRVAVFSRDFSDINGAVWLIRLADEGVLERWFPLQGRASSGTVRGVRFFRTEGGVTVCRHEGTVALSRRWGPDSLLYETIGLMAGKSGDTLGRHVGFRELKAYLPAEHLAVAYVVRDEASHAATATASPWWPALSRAVIGLYEGEGRLDVAIRASLAAPHHKPKLERVALERLLRLPQTTLFASATTLDLDQAYRSASTGPSQGALGRYLTLLAAVAGKSPGQSQPGYGPHVIFLWGQDLREGESTPQPAVMIEIDDPDAVAAHARQVAQRLIRLAQVLDPAKVAAPLVIEERRHLGFRIMHLPLTPYSKESQLPFMRLLRNVEPAWVVWNGWLIVAFSREHIEQILEAQFGLVPSLASVADVQALRKRSVSRSVLSIVQPGLATDVLDRWLTALEAGGESLLDASWWAGETRPVPNQQPRLGIGMRIVQEPGVVTVARVYPETAAERRLEQGDRILGIDGYLLSLTSPNADLRERWASSASEPGPTVRVQRADTTIEVVLPKKKEGPLLSKIRIEPADAVRELVSLGRTLDFVSFSVHVPDERHYSARLSLRFAREHVSKASASKYHGARGTDD